MVLAKLPKKLASRLSVVVSVLKRLLMKLLYLVSVSYTHLLVGAFKLFLVKEYADVTTADLEEIIGLSRGAIYLSLIHIYGKDAKQL